MTALHVVVRPRPLAAPNPALATLHGVLDVVVDGVNLTARVGEGQAVDFLTDLAFATVSVVASARRRTSVPLQTAGEVWELGLEAAGSELRLSVFSPGPVASVAAHDRPVALAAFRTALLDAINTALVDTPDLPMPARLGLKSARDAVQSLPAEPLCPLVQHHTKSVEAKLGSLRLRARLRIRTASGNEPRGGQQLERADLLSLLGVGALSLQIGKQRLFGGDAQVFLDAERLLGLAECAFESFRSARPTFRRTQLSCARLSMRRGPGEARLELTVSSAAAGSASAADGSGGARALLSADQFVRLAAGFASKLALTICELDPAQRRNLRLRNLAERAQVLSHAVEASADDESIANPSPASYSRFVPRVRRAVGIWETGPKMRFMPRWVATVPQIDLRATFLCGELLMVGGATETACLHRLSGEVQWKRPTRPAACVVTPAGLVRVEPDGLLRCHELSDGEVRFSLNVTPRMTGAVAGAALHGPSLPKLIALVEGDRQVTGIDLLSGAVRWRHSAKRPGNYRLRRAGRLLVLSGGDPLMVALDAVNGDVVWSLRARLPFCGDVVVDHDCGLTVSGVPGGRFRLHCFNPWSGEARWEVELDERPFTGRPPLLTSDTVIVPTLEAEGGGAVAFDRRTGKKLWEHAPGLVSSTSAWLAVDDCVIVNSASGMLMAIGARDGAARFQHVFSSSPDADQPRRLEPVLRSGALFVPQQRVHVVRPRDGELLGTLDSDLIPDLIRVDERCDVYVAEESGHLAAFGAAPRLALVR